MCTSSGKQYSHLDPVSSSHVRFCLTTAYVWRWEKLCTRYKNVIQPWLNLCDHFKMSQLLLMRLSGITRVHVIFRNVHGPHSTKWQVHCQVSFPGRSPSTPVPPTAGKTNTHWGENIGSLAGRPTLLWKQTLESKGEKETFSEGLQKMLLLTHLTHSRVTCGSSNPPLKTSTEGRKRNSLDCCENYCYWGENFRSLSGPQNPSLKTNTWKKENILWIFVEWLLFDIMRSFQCEPFLLSVRRCNAMVEQKTTVIWLF